MAAPDSRLQHVEGQYRTRVLERSFTGEVVVAGQERLRFFKINRDWPSLMTNQKRYSFPWQVMF